MYEFFKGNYRWSYMTLLAFSAGGQLGDIALVVSKLKDRVGDDGAWHDAWTWLGEVLEGRAEGASKATASETLFLAAVYHMIGELFVPPADPRRLIGYRRVLACFEQAMGLSSLGMQRVEVPFEQTALPAYFLPASTIEKRPTVIFICGLDTTKELWFLRARRQFIDRNMNCLFVDTPGIGEALRYNKLYTRHDYEVPVAAIVDYLSARSDVDPNRIGLIGSSLGGYYVTRAAAYERRLRATVAWGAIYDYHRVWVRRIRDGAVSAAPGFQLMFITGASSMEEAVARIADFKAEPAAGLVTCPFLVVHGKDDQQVPLADAEALFRALGSGDKTLKVFSGEDGGSAHTQFDNHLPALHFVADWMGSRLSAP